MVWCVDLLRYNPRMNSEQYGFLAGGGEMGAIIRAFDWASTPIGEPKTWPQTLKTCLRLLLSTGHPMFIWWGPELIQFYNDAYRRSIGPERHPSAIGQRGRECWEEIWDIIGPQIDQVMAGDGHTWHENQLVPITRYGRREEVFWTYSYSPIDDPDAPNAVGGILVLCTETTEQVLAEQRMREAEARWRALFNQSPGFMCVLTGPNHQIEFANPGFFSLLGNRDIVGESMLDLVPGDQDFIALLNRVYESGEAYTGVATPLLLKTLAPEYDKPLYIDFVYQPVCNEDDEVTGILVEGSDVTDRVVATQKLEAENRRKNKFLAMLGHELRNPLAPIKSTSELLQTSDYHPDAQKLGAVLLRQVNQLSHLVDDLLDVSRITRDRIELHREDQNLLDGVNMAIEAVLPAIKEKGHELAKSFPERPVYVNMDMTRIVQCITNILSNASKFTRSGGRIEIGLRTSGDTAVLTVHDNGAGMDAATLDDAFELFYQDDQSLDRSSGGIGVGLSLARRLVEMHDGKILAASEGIGKGSTIEIRLPLVETPELPEERPDVDQISGQRRILIVDDNVDAADALAQLLKIDGHDCVPVYHAREALAKFGSFDPDIVLLDIGLPEINGYELAQKIRSNNEKVQLIAVTGYAQDEDIQNAHDAGFDSHVTKPIDIEKIRRLVNGN